jgi:hypothetical protein
MTVTHTGYLKSQPVPKQKPQLQKVEKSAVRVNLC